VPAPDIQCSRCTAQLSRELANGLCPACLLEVGIGNLEAESSSSTPPRPSETASAVVEPQFPQTFGDYELLGEIARGGQGVVYRARHAQLQRDVALKMFPSHPWTSPADLERFRTEARVAADLDHPAIVPIFDIGEVHGQHFFAMKLVDGIGLHQLSSNDLLPARRSADIVCEAARAIQHAHERGVLHRDVKPGNILLDRAGHPHITDFGLAKLLETDSTLTRTRDVLGTPSYISPEVAAGGGRKLSTATDVYGLGTVLYHLLTGQPPFAGGTTLETIRQVLETDPRRPRLWNPKLDRDLETICLKCLEKDPARRYHSAAALADDLERWLHHEPIHARAGSLAYRGRKWLRRNAVSASVTAVILFAAAVMGWSVRHASTSAAPQRTLAVLLHPADTESRYLASEFSRNLMHLLGNLPAIRLVPRTELLKWEGSNASVQRIGESLRIPTLLSGTVRQSGGSFQLQIELVDVASGTVRWSKTQDAPLSAGADLQTQVSRAVASQLGIELTARNRRELRPALTTYPKAWAHYVRGRQLLDTQSEPNLVQATVEFDQAIACDPAFSHAYAGLADAHLGLGYMFREPLGHFAKAREYVRAALDRDETLPDALLADGVLKYFLEWDWAAAERSVKQAVLLDASKLENHACYLHCLETVGRIEEALEIVRAAAAAHPSSIMIQSELGCANYYAGRFAEAETFWRDTLKRDPENAYLRWGVARTLVQLQRMAEAGRELEIAQTKPGGDWAAIVAEVAYLHGRENRRAEALRVIADLRDRASREFIDSYFFAIANVGIGETDEVFRELALAARARSVWIPSLPVDPKFAPLRSDPRFLGLLATLKLPPK
jgi:TolB-like protein/tetratricopeptide (TPR) repeat protein